MFRRFQQAQHSVNQRHTMVALIADYRVAVKQSLANCYKAHVFQESVFSAKGAGGCQQPQSGGLSVLAKYLQVELGWRGAFA